MSEVIFDPEDPSQAIIGSGAEATLGIQMGPVTIGNVHAPEKCWGRPCVMHNPSDHPLRSWKLNWRDDRGMMERLCPEHGVGHPDPDALAFHISIGQEWWGVHGCCGCCVQ